MSRDDLEKEFSVRDPFSEEPELIHFKCRTVTPDIYGNLNMEEWRLKNIRLFAGREIKPRFYNWFSTIATLPNCELTPFHVRMPQVVNNMFDEVAALLGASEEVRERAMTQVPLCLFGSGDIPELSKRCVAFLIKHFSAYRASSFCSHDFDSPVIEYDVTTTRGENNEYFDQIFHNYKSLAENMLNSSLGFAPILSTAMLATYSAICRAYFCNIIQKTNSLMGAQLRSVDNLLRSWVATFPSMVHFRAASIADSSHRAVCKIVIDLLMDQIYVLAVVDFPRSYHTIQTLRYCMSQTMDYGRDRIVSKLIADVSARLLTVAEETSVMLDGYATCVESLRELDPSCSIMHRVCSVIKEYLKKRPDTVRKIINYITSEKRDQLAEHLGTKSGTIVDQEEFAGTNDEFLPEAMEMKGYDLWKPDPPDAPAGQSSHVRQSADVFNMLISVYGSKEMFVKEYRKLLAERLTSFSDKDPAFELRYLEVLKQRFNEGELQQCEVMLKDVEESLRIDTIASSKQMELKCVPINACIISSHFWPGFENDKIADIPKVLEEGLEAYHETYKAQKPNRRLNWLRSWGWVDVEIELGGVTVNRCVSNAHAAVLYLFAEKEQWTAAEVSERLGITKGVARRRLEWWGNQALFVQALPAGATSEVWSLATSAAGLEHARHGEESEDEDQATIEDVADAADALEAYWIYTRNYIAQNESVRADRIHKIFRMFSSPSAQSPSLDVVNTFLFRKVKQNLLTFQGGTFRVVKDNNAK